MRILLVTGSLAHGGAERQSVALTNRLAERGHECHALYIKAEAALLDQIRLRGRGSARSLDATRYLDWRAIRDFAARIAELGPAAIMAANSYALLYATLAMRVAGLRVPLIVTYHSTRLLQLKERLQMLVYRPLFWAADCSVFVCERQKEHWAQRALFSRRNEVIHNGVDLDAFSNRMGDEERRWLRRALGFSDTDFVIGLSAVMRPEKNHLQLIDALSGLHRMKIPAKALLIGDGPMRGQILERARVLGVERHVVMTGLKKDVRSYIEATDAMTLCSITEALSMAAIEAMALRRPVVLSDVGGAAELVVPGENGYLFRVGDTNAFVEKLALLADRRRCREMGEKARALVQKRFSENVMVDRYEQLLVDLCGAGLADAQPRFQ